MSKPASENTWTKQISDSGEFKRKPTTFRNAISASSEAEFPAASGRYHLYVSYACPWAHRTLMVRKIKGLEDAISYDVVDWLLTDKGWTFQGENPGETKDRVNNTESLREIYSMANPDYEGSITVPVLWDREAKTIVNNESSEIIRMLNSEFNEFAKYPEVDLYPEKHQDEINELNDMIYPAINNGVYRAGFAQSQQAYEKAIDEMFPALDKLERRLSEKRYLVGETLTEADVRLFTTLVRFDSVYVTHFKCNVRRIVDYPNLWGYVRDLFQHPGVAETVNMEHIKNHYFKSHKTINPFSIVPSGPDIDFQSPHNRENL